MVGLYIEAYRMMLGQLRVKSVTLKWQDFIEHVLKNTLREVVVSYLIARDLHTLQFK
jgi:hypothetical protein